MYIVAHKIHVRTKANNIETKIKFKNLNWSEVNQLAINIYFLNTSTAEYTVIIILNSRLPRTNPASG